MNPEEDFAHINKNLWNKKTSFHIDSDFYDNPSFIEGRSSLNSIELELLGDVKGKSILHLQCHFGQDTISLARMGAEAVGVDLSDAAIDEARKLASKTEANAKFICCNIYDLPQHLDQQFDIVFTSYGTIGWLPDLDKWASIIDQFLKPGGKFVFVEFHPIIWMFDQDINSIVYNYFKDAPIIENNENTYADNEAEVNLEEITWNHSIAEVFTALVSKEMTIASLQEIDYSPYDCFKGLEEFEKGKFRFKKYGNKIPMVYTFQATKP